jgi:hypothetical protein
LQALTRYDEIAVAMLARIGTHQEPTEAQRAEMRKSMSAARKQFPNAYAAMKMSANEVRNFLRGRGVARPSGISLTDIPVVSMGQPEFLAAIKNFAIKLFCALHYKHTGKILLATGSIGIKMLSNVMVEDGVIPEEMLKIVGKRADLKRSNNNLDQQFGYLYTVSVEQTMSVYLCAFRRSFALIGMASESPLLEGEWAENTDRGSYLGAPFQHKAS